jgi:hypothetical protein
MHGAHWHGTEAGTPERFETFRALDESEPLISSDRYAEHEHYHIDIEHSIYAAAVYAPFVARIKTGSNYSSTIFIVYVMVALNMVLQLGLVYVINVYAHAETNRRPVIAVHEKAADANGFMAHPFPRKEEDMETNPALCLLDHGNYSCMPPSLHFAAEWNSLDTNADGLWSIEEAAAADQGEELAKKQVVFFDMIVGGLKHRAEWMSQINETLYLSQDVLATRAIPKAYFEYWAGDAMLCTRFDSLACEEMVKSGLFDAALEHGHLAAAHKGIFDYSSATRYCRMMLEDNGGCERSLPASFKSAVLERKSKCGEASLSYSGMVANPYEPSEMLTVMEPSYKNLSAQKTTQDKTFLFFATLILYLFYASLASELRGVIKTVDFLISYPSTYNAQDRGGIDRGESSGTDERYQILRISPWHRVALTVVAAMRIAVLAIVLSFGTWFLLTEDSHIELVLNAVALSFITCIDEVIYEGFIESTTKKEIGFDEVERLKYRGYIGRADGSISGAALRKDLWGCVLLPAISIVGVLLYAYSIRDPVITALTCACLQEGQHCAEAFENRAAWWQRYWTHTLPAAVHQIEAMRLQGV